MLTIYDANECLKVASLIQNKADVINAVLGYGYLTPDAASVVYPRGAGYGEFRVCGVPLLRWRRYDIDAIQRAMDCVQTVDNAVFAMAASGHLFWF